MKVKDGFQDYLNYLKQKGYADHTIGEYKRFFRGALSHAYIIDKNVKNLKLTDVASVIESGKAHGEYGSQRAVSVFRCYCKFLKHSGIKLNFDYRDIEVPRVPDKIQPVLEKKEMNEFLRKIPLDTITGLRLRTLLEVLFSTGLRVGEAASLNKEDIDWQKKEAKLKGKGGIEGMVYFTKRSLYWLARYLNKRKDDQLALFVNQLGTARLKTVTARNRLREFVKGLGIAKRITHHTFRRTLATYLIEQGANIKATQYLMRHKSERTTLKYYIIADKRKAKLTHRKILGKV